MDFSCYNVNTVNCFKTPVPTLPSDVFSAFYISSIFQDMKCLCVLEPPPSTVFLLLRYPSRQLFPPSRAVGRFSNIHYFHQGHCNPTGSAKDLAGADKGPPRTRHYNNLTNPSLTQNPLRQRGIPVFSIKPLKSTWCHIVEGAGRGGPIG